jgi:hypothetical protein
MLTERHDFSFTLLAFSSALLVFFLQVSVIDAGAVRHWTAPYNADIATGMDKRIAYD